MANTKISELPLYTGNTDGTFIVINNSDNTESFKVEKETLFSGYTTNVVSPVTGSWTLPVGASIQSFTVDPNNTYTMWVRGNVPNGIVTWNATATVSNTNVPVVGTQYCWYYDVGNALVLTAIPDQFTGTNGSILTTPGAYVPNTSNVFNFGITNNSGSPQTIYWGYVRI
jgi:hypothetical protein